MKKVPNLIPLAVALLGIFNQEKALVGAFSVIVQPVVEPMDRFAALTTTHLPVPASEHAPVVASSRPQGGFVVVPRAELSVVSVPHPVLAVAIETKIHTKVRNHGEGRLLRAISWLKAP